VIDIQTFLAEFPLPPGCEIVSEQQEVLNETDAYMHDPYGRRRVEIALLEFTCEGGWPQIQEHYDGLLCPLGFLDPFNIMMQRQWQEFIDNKIARGDSNVEQAKVKIAKAMIAEKVRKSSSLYYSQPDNQWALHIENRPASAEYARQNGRDWTGRDDMYELFVTRMDAPPA